MLVGITHENLKFMRTNFGRNFIHDSEKGANTSSAGANTLICANRM